MHATLRSEWRVVFLGFLLTFCSSPGQTFFISLFSASIRDSLALSHAAFGGIYSLATLASAVAILWTGTLVDKLDLRQCIALVTIGLAIACILLPAAYSPVLLFIAFFTLRQLGQSMMMLMASTAIVRYIPAQMGKASALSGLGYISAEAILPMLVIAAIAAIGWEHTLQYAGAVLLIFMLPLFFYALGNHRQRHERYLASIAIPASNHQADKKSAESSQPETTAIVKKHWQRHEVLRDKCFYLFMPAFLAQGMLFTGFIFHQLHIVESKRWSLDLWASLFVMYAIAGVISKLLTGIAIDRIGARNIMPFGTLPMACGLLALAFLSNTPSAIVFMLGMGISTGIQTTVSAPLWAEIYGTRHIGSIKSVTSSAIAFGTAITPFAMGWMIDRGVEIAVLALGAIAYILLAMLAALWAKNLSERRLK